MTRPKEVPHPVSEKVARGELDLATLLELQQYAAVLVGSGLTVADARSEGFPLVYCDKAFLALTGYTRAEIIGKNCNFLQGKETNPQTVAQLRAALHASPPLSVSVVLRNYRKDGSMFWNALRIDPVFRDGELTHFVGIQKDVSEAMEYSRAASEQARELANLQIKLERLEGLIHELSRVHEALVIPK